MLDLSMKDALLFIQAPKRFVFAMTRGLTPHEDVDLNFSQLRTLLLLRDLNPATMHELGYRVGMSKGSFTQVVDGLVDAGMVKRSRSSEDRRCVEVSITEKGERTTKLADDNFRKHVMGKLEGIDKKEVDKIIAALKTINETAVFFEKKERTNGKNCK